jgi:polysaccharide deacetylase 2 family uncharacterized protein YibQ
MKASEAKKLADEGGLLDEEKLKEIYTIIEMRAKLGLHKTGMGNYLGAKAVINQLKIDEFKCTLVADQREGDYWQIEW